MEELIERSNVAREQWESEGQMVHKRLCGGVWGPRRELQGPFPRRLSTPDDVTLTVINDGF